jgi:peroxiredoxin
MSALPHTNVTRTHGAYRTRRSGAVGAAVLAAVAFALAFGCACLAYASEREARDALVGREAPDFTQRALGGGNFRLSERRGEVVVVGFWTSWCSTCRAQLERLGRIDQTYGNAGLVVVGVSLDDDPERARGLARAVDAKFRNVIDVDKQLGRAYRVNDVPMTVLVDRSGVVRFVHGELSRTDEADLYAQIRKLLDE